MSRWGLSPSPSERQPLTKPSASATTAKRHEPEAEVFFFDGSKDVQCQYDSGAKHWSWRDTDADDASSQTASSSDGSFAWDRTDLLGRSSPSLCAWEDIGDVSTLAASLRPIDDVDATATSCLRVDPHASVDVNAVQVDELDVVEVRPLVH